MRNNTTIRLANSYASSLFFKQIHFLVAKEEAFTPRNFLAHKTKKWARSARSLSLNCAKTAPRRFLIEFINWFELLLRNRKLSAKLVRSKNRRKEHSLAASAGNRSKSYPTPERKDHPVWQKLIWGGENVTMSGQPAPLGSANIWRGQWPLLADIAVSCFWFIFFLFRNAVWSINFKR